MVLIEGIPWQWFAKRRVIEADPLFTGRRYYEPGVPDREQKWACISHVWGKVAKRSVPGVIKNGLPFELLLNDNPLKAEAISELATRTDILPVWLDIYSIDQDDETDKSAQVTVMGEIYALARLCFTIIDDDGFVSQKLYTQELFNGNERKTKDLQSVTEKILRSHYSQRIWTIQEATLSRKSVYIVCDKLHGRKLLLQDDEKEDDLSNFTITSEPGQYVNKILSTAVNELSLRESDAEYDALEDELQIRFAVIAPVFYGDEWNLKEEYKARHCSVLRDYAFGAAPALGLKLGSDYVSSSDEEVIYEWMTALVALKLIPRPPYPHVLKESVLGKSGYLNLLRIEIGAALIHASGYILGQLNLAMPGKNRKKTELFGTILHQLYKLHFELTKSDDSIFDGIDSTTGVLLCRSCDQPYSRALNPILMFSELNGENVIEDHKSMILISKLLFKPEYFDSTSEYNPSLKASILYAVGYFLLMESMHLGKEVYNYFEKLLANSKRDMDMVQPKLPVDIEKDLVAIKNKAIHHVETGKYAKGCCIVL